MKAWMRKLLSPVRFVGRHWDAFAALAAAAVAFALSTKHAVREDAVTVLLALAAAGLAVLSIVLGSMAIFATFFDQHYRRVLEQAGGMSIALRPFLIVATAGALALVIGVLATLAWPVGGWLLQAALTSVTAALGAYAVFGGLSLVELTIFHAQQRAELQRGIDDARARQAERLTRRTG
jgi:hypothetical protein